MIIVVALLSLFTFVVSESGPARAAELSYATEGVSTTIAPVLPPPTGTRQLRLTIFNGGSKPVCILKSHSPALGFVQWFFERGKLAQSYSGPRAKANLTGLFESLAPDHQHVEIFELSGVEKLQWFGLREGAAYNVDVKVDFKAYQNDIVRLNPSCSKAQFLKLNSSPLIGWTP